MNVYTINRWRIEERDAPLIDAVSPALIFNQSIKSIFFLWKTTTIKIVF